MFIEFPNMFCTKCHMQLAVDYENGMLIYKHFSESDCEDVEKTVETLVGVKLS